MLDIAGNLQYNDTNSKPFLCFPNVLETETIELEPT